jgi:hypothetical protein
MGLMEERETRYRVDTLLGRLMDNIPVLARPADTPAPSQSHEAGAQAPAEATPNQHQGRAPRPIQTNLAGYRSRGRERYSAEVKHVIERVLSTNGQPFVIHRGGERIGEATGLKDGRSRSILFLPGVDIVVGDWLEDSKGQTRLFVADVDHMSDLSGGSPSHLEVLYETRIEYERQESSAQVIAMLDDIADAVWTLSDTKMPPEKKEHVRALVRELQGIVKSLPPGVAGGLAGEIAARFVDGN